MPQGKKDRIKMEGHALKTIEKRRKTHQLGRVKDQFSVWGACQDSIISHAINGHETEPDRSGSDNSHSPKKTAPSQDPSSA